MQYLRRLIAVVLLAIAASGPALALSPSAFQVLFSGGWWLPGASVDMNFAQAKYYGCDISCVSVARASTGYAQTASGTLVNFAAGVPRITDQGFLVEEARTNKCTNFNANPTDLTNVTKSGDAAAVLSVVDDTAALLAAGLQNIATSGKVYKLDNSAGVGNSFVSFGGITGNTNAHSFQIYSRQTAGASGVTLSLSSSEGIVTVPATAIYSSSKSQNVIPTAGGRVLLVTAPAGRTVYFILNQLEEGAFVTSPIVVAGASATRAADVPQLIGPAATAALAAKAAFFQTSGVAGGSLNSLLVYSGGALIRFGSSTTVQVGNGTQTAAATIGASATYAGGIKSAAGFDAASMTSVSNGGTQVVNANAWSTGTGTVDLGNRAAGDRALNGYMQRFALSPSKGVFDQSTAP